MAKVGYLFMNNGIWNGTQVVSSEWIDAMKINYPSAQNYGYLTWISEGDPTYWYASGAGGQFIAMIPEYNIVVVITGIASHYSLSDFVRDYYVFPSLLDS